MTYRFTPTMVEMLTAHLLGSCPWKRKGVSGEERRARDRLIYQGYIQPKRRTVADVRGQFPIYRTDLTEAGRWAIAIELARIADELDPDGYGLPVDAPSIQSAVTLSPSPSTSQRIASLPADESPSAIKSCRSRERAPIGGGAK